MKQLPFALDDEYGLPLPPAIPRMEVDVEDEFGLPPVPPQRLRRVLEIDDDNLTGFEDIDNNTGSTPTPQDPHPSNGFNSSFRNVKFNDFLNELIFTLASKYTGYNNLGELKADLRKDAGFMPDMVAQQRGFATFEALIRSDEMKQYIDVQYIGGENYFLPKDCTRFEHIRNDQEITTNAKFRSMEDDERQKLMRSQFPENRDAAIEGRKRIAEIVHELGGQDKPVLWQDIQAKYRAKYEVELAGQELKKFFLRDKALCIVNTMLAKEIETHSANVPGQFYLKFRMPYPELVEYYEEQLRTHSEAEAMLKRLRGCGGNGNSAGAGPSAPGGSHRRVIYPTGPMMNPRSKDLQQYMEADSTSKLKNPQQQQQPQTSNSSNVPTSSGNAAKAKSGSKFISTDDIVINRQPTFGESLAGCPDTGAVANAKDASDQMWKEQEDNHVKAYQPPGDDEEEEEGPSTGNKKVVGLGQPWQNGKAGTSANDKQPNNKRAKYTTAFQNAEYTDSEEEGDDDEEENADDDTVVGAGGEFPAAANTGATSTSAVNHSDISGYTLSTTTERLSAHQKTAQKKASAGTNSGPVQQRLPTIHENSSSQPLPATAFQQHQPAASSNAAASSSSSFAMPSPVKPAAQSTGIHQQDNHPTPAALFQQQLMSPYIAPSIRTLSSMANPPSALFGPPADWTLMDRVDGLRQLANKLHLSHESRPDEGSFAFRSANTNLLLVLTEFEDKVRVAVIRKERYYPKVDWEMFAQTVRGIIDDVFLADSPDTFLVGTANIGMQANRSYGEWEWDESAGWGAPPAGLRRLSTPRRAARSDDFNSPDGWSNLGAGFTPTNVTMTRRRRTDGGTPWGTPPTAEAVEQWRPNDDTAEEEKQQRQQQQAMSSDNNTAAVASYVGQKAQEMQRGKQRRPPKLPRVPEECKTREPPYPAYCTTTDGRRDFLAFFTRIYGFSNHYPVEFRIEGDTYYCSEQYYMRKKAETFGFHAAAGEIMATRNPSKIKELGTADTLRRRQREGLEPEAREFDHDEWRERKADVMRIALEAKFTQNNFLYDMLIGTGNAHLVEASATDLFWGCGCALGSEEIGEPSTWRGGNRMGTLLVELRNQFRRESGH